MTTCTINNCLSSTLYTSNQELVKGRDTKQKGKRICTKVESEDKKKKKKEAAKEGVYHECTLPYLLTKFLPRDA